MSFGHMSGDSKTVRRYDGGPAFPFGPGYPGMTLRDWLAGMALQGMISCQDFVNEAIKACGSREEARKALSAWAYEQADQMLCARTAEPIENFWRDA